MIHCGCPRFFKDLQEEKGTGYFSVVTSSDRVLEALSKDEKLVPIVQAVQWVRQAHHDRPDLPLILSVVEGFAQFKSLGSSDA